jgi:simple sugar transport system permease protein
VKRTTSGLLLLLMVFAVVLGGIALGLGKDFFNMRNIFSMGFQIPEFGFLALAMAVTILTGGIDLSVVATMNLSSILAAYVLTNQVSLVTPGTAVPLGIAIALVTGLLCGLLNGLLIARLGVPPILATIGTMLFYRGIAMALTGGKGVVGFPGAFAFVGNGRIYGFPFPLALVLLAFLLVGFLLRSTAWGKSVYFIGESRSAARFSGIGVTNTLVLAYALSGLLCGFSALILSSRVNSARVGYGDTYLLQAILVAILGGLDPRGGAGSTLGVLFGIFILQSLSSTFTLLAITPYARGLIYGVMLLGVMILNRVYDVRSSDYLRRLTTLRRTEHPGGSS